MGEANISVDEQQLCCPICLDLLVDPVTIPCGHSYCMRCIRGFWDGDVQRSAYYCPQCRRDFAVRPELSRNVVLAELVDKLRNSRDQQPPPEERVKPGGVLCDVCGDEKLAAVKSCLVCLASYCESHLQPHFLSPAFKLHTLLPSRPLQICPAHGRLQEFYCRTDRVCVCYLCTAGDHAQHDTVTTASARAEKAEELNRWNRSLNQKIQEREKACKDLNKAIKSMKHSAQSAKAELDHMFSELLTHIMKKRSEVMEQLKVQEETEVKEAEGLLEQVELEMADLKRMNLELEQTLQTDDHVDFLQRYLSLKCPSGPQVFTSPTPNQNVTFKGVTSLVSKLQKMLEDTSSTWMRNIFETIEDVTILQGSTSKGKTYKPEKPLSLTTEPTTREELLYYACYLTLEPRPNHPSLSVREGNRSVERVAQNVAVNMWPQVLCREGLSGRCYWEVKRDGSGVFTIALVHGHSGAQQSQHSGFGRDHQSWGLDCFQLSYVFHHDNRAVSIAAPTDTGRVGVYLDHRAGTLAFYSVSDTAGVRLLHKVHARFTQPLWPGFALWTNGWQVDRHVPVFTNSSLTITLINL